MAKETKDRGAIEIAPQGQKVVKVDLLEDANGDVARVTWPFKFHSPSHPVLAKLREREKLDEVIAPGKTHFEKTLLLKRWAGQNTRGRGGVRYPSWNAVEILDNIRGSDDIIVMCGQAAMVFLQACCSLGIQCRYVEIGTKRNPYCHWLTEVYLTDFDKWAIVDATPQGNCNVYITRDGIPQSGLELHNAYLSGDYDDLVAVHDPQVTDPKHDQSAQQIIPMYYYFRVIFTQDHQTENPPYFDLENTFDRWNDAIEWQDELTVPWTENRNSKPWCLPHRQFCERSTSREEDLYWRPTDECRVEMRWFDGTNFRVKLNNLCPDFERYLVRLDGGQWKRLDGASRPAPAPGQSADWFAWEIEPGTHSIEARTLTKAGKEGPVARLRFELKKL